jgi:holliday junction DNA helicase RuvA
MIGSLRGSVNWTAKEEVCVETAGVGYVVKVNSKTLTGFNESDEAFVYIYHHIREDSETLYGFLSLKDRTLFSDLLGVQGIGPSLALSITGTFSPEQLGKIVTSEDVDLLCAVPGVGRKTAQRLLMELKNKIDVTQLSDDENADTLSCSGQDTSFHKDVVDALINLGYSRAESARVVADMPEQKSVEDALLWSLQRTTDIGGR